MLYYTYFSKNTVYLCILFKVIQMKKVILLLALISIASIAANAQKSKIRYQGDLTIGYSFDVSNKQYPNDIIQFNFVNGIRFNKYFSAGIGLGVEYQPLDNEFYVPLFLDVKAYFSHSKAACVFAALDIGTSFSTTYGDPSLLLNPSIGANLYVGKGTNAITLAVGYDLRTYRAKPSIKYAHSINFKVGFSF